jgi:hypothetical protein
MLNRSACREDGWGEKGVNNRGDFRSNTSQINKWINRKPPPLIPPPRRGFCNLYLLFKGGQCHSETQMLLYSKRGVGVVRKIGEKGG